MHISSVQAIALVHRRASDVTRSVQNKPVSPVLVIQHGPVSTSLFSWFKPSLLLVREIQGFIFLITFSFGAALKAIWNLLKHAEL